MNTPAPGGITPSSGFPKFNLALVGEVLATPIALLGFLTTAIFAVIGLSVEERLMFVAQWLQVTITLLCMVGAAWVLASVLWRWRRRALQLTELDHSFIFVVISIAFALVTASVNYLIYSVDRNAFLIDSSSSDYYWSQHTNHVSETIRIEKTVTNITGHLILALTNHTEALKFTHRKEVPTSIGECKVWINQIDVQAGGSMGSVTLTHYELAASLGATNAILVDSLERFTRSDDKFVVSAKDLREQLNNRAQTAKNRLTTADGLLLQAASYRLPFALFVYHDVMAMLQSNLRLYTPVSTTARVIAVFAAFVRYVFFGLLVSITIRTLSRK